MEEVSYADMIHIYMHRPGAVSYCLFFSTGASSVPAFFSEDDSQSNDSSDSDSSSSQSDDIEQETFMLDEPLERTTNSSHANGAAQAPRSMQWAVRNTQNQRTTSTAPSSTSTPAGKSESIACMNAR